MIDRTKKGFDVAMEILCSIPPEPKAVRMKDLAADFGMGSQLQVRTAMKPLAERGLVFVVNNGLEGREVCIKRESWTAAKAMAEEYWEKTSK